MGKTTQQLAAKFLKKNGFKKINKDHYDNGKCNVIVGENQYNIEGNGSLYEGTYFTADLTIYALIGYLTYYGYMDRNYKQ